MPRKELLDFPKGITGKFSSPEPHTVLSPPLTDDQELGVNILLFPPKHPGACPVIGQSFGLGDSAFKCEGGNGGVVVARSFEYSL